MIPSRWDPSTPGFTIAVLRTIIALGSIQVIASAVVFRTAVWGTLSGCLLALALYLVALRAGSVFAHTGNYGRTMAWLLVSQSVLWLGTAVLLAYVKVHAVGFVVGVSILPVAILVTLAWYAFRKSRLPS